MTRRNIWSLVFIVIGILGGATFVLSARVNYRTEAYGYLALDCVAVAINIWMATSEMMRLFKYGNR